MTVSDNLTQFSGRPVENFDAEKGIADPRGIAYAVRLDWEAADEGTTITDVLEKLLDDPQASALEALVIGAWDFEQASDSSAVVELLASARDRLPALRALFLGDIMYEEQEMSWIQQSDVSPLLLAFPELTVLRVRGSDGLRVGAIRHQKLRELAFESGGLPGEVIERAVHADCPELAHFELWLGSDGYGYTGSLDMLAPLLTGNRFPKLKYLGLKNSEEQDEIARRVAASPLLARLDVLDLGMGTLTDEGAQALLDSPHLGKLKKLAIAHHYVSEAMADKLRAKVAELDASDAKAQDEHAGETYRYIAVSE